MNKFIATLSLGTVSLLATTGAFAGEGCKSGESCSSKADAKLIVNSAAGEDISACSAKSVNYVSNCAEKKDCSGEKACSDEAKTEKIVMDNDSDVSILQVDYQKTEDAASASYTLGSKVADFKAVHAQTGETKSLSDIDGDKATVIIFWNQECPYVTGSNGADKAVMNFVKEYADKGVSVIGIDAGVNNSEESITAYSKNLNFPLLMNRDSSLAAAFHAKYTPHTFVLDADHKLVYAGAFHTGNGDKIRTHTQNAVDDILAGNEPVVKEAKGVGCGIKWAPGSRPNT